MSYNTLSQHDDRDVDRLSSRSPSPNNGRALAPPPRALFLDELHDDDTNGHHTPPHRFNSPPSSHKNGFSNLVHSMASGRTRATYDMLEGDDFAADAPNSPTLLAVAEPPPKKTSDDEPVVHRPLPRRERRSPPATTNPRSRKEGRPTVRTASGRSVALRHPTPDLQTLQGAYTGNVEHLERTAERLSMTSSIEDAIRELHDEQKRSDSRRSSLLESQGIAISRQVSNASSIVEVNSAARSGGFSPAAFIMSPGGSMTGSGRGRSASRSSRFGARPEPELEGRPLDALIASSAPNSPLLARSLSIPEFSPHLRRTDSIPEQDEDTTATQPMLQPTTSPLMEQEEEIYKDVERPRSPASIHTLDQAPSIFAGFDGVHVEDRPEAHRSTSGQESDEPEGMQKRMSSANRLTMGERPQSYADPLTGQQMVYYPAPVPMMLNLPQKLSKNPSSMARNKRRTQVLSTLPPAARKSAIWLPDVLETENEPDLAADDIAQQQEYIPQHQRATMGGRRNTHDISHIPPQLRASTFFDLPAPPQMVELKEQSPMATLDSILDASAFAPVNAFTDHAFAGRLGAEVYGKENKRASKSAANLLEVPKQRNSAFGALLGRRASSGNLLESDKEKRRATMSGVIESGKRQPIDSEDEEADEDAEGEEDSEDDAEDTGAELYHGPPTTLLAELQLRKQQQKQRTRPLTTAFPNGVHSTLLELDAVAQVEQKTRKQKRVNLAWEDPSLQELNDADADEDVPLGLLYSKKHQDPNRPLGLMERRDIEDNEPLSKRRDRLLGIPPQQRQMMRASTMMNLSTPADDNEDEPLAQRIRRLKEAQRTSTGLPAPRPVSGDFTSELMSQLGVDASKETPPKSHTPAGEEEETLGQRRKRLQAEREARALAVSSGAAVDRPVLKTRHSMADILQAHPAAGSAERALSYQKPVSGLLALHEKEKSKRTSTMLELNTQAHRVPSGGVPRSSSYGNNMLASQSVPQFAQPSINGFGYNSMNPGMLGGGYTNPGGYNAFPNQQMMFQNPYAMNMNMNMNMNMGYMNGMNPMGMMGMPMGVEPLNQGQIDMVERWRQSVMQ